MIYQDLKKQKLPDVPGVYFFRGGRKKILYIGKASSLRDRTRSYFNKNLIKTRGEYIVSMVDKAKSIDFTKTDSVLEALILEANLIKKYKPEFNTKEKDDKSFNYVVITKEDFPRISLVRGRQLKTQSPDLSIKYKHIFGPFPNGGELRDALKIIRKIFSWRDKCVPNTGKQCFYRQIKLCPGVCFGEITKKEYAKIIKNIKLFFEGKKETILKNFKKEMLNKAKNLEFEKAEKIKKSIFALKHIQDISLIKSHKLYQYYQRLPLVPNVAFGNTGRVGLRVEAYDVAHLYGQFAVGVMTVLEDGELNKDEYRKFKIRSFKGVDDTRALAEILERRLAHSEWQYPRFIVVDGGKAQKNIAEKVLKKYGIEISVVGVVKDEHHKPKNIIGGSLLIQKYEKEILLANAEAHRFAIKYHRLLRGKLNK